jgi:esterase/lipase
MDWAMLRKVLYFVFGWLALTAAAQGETTGVVLLHGKQGMPRQMQQVSNILSDAGFLVEQPEMCWSATRIYDQTYLDCFGDIDAATDRLKARGASAIVVLGMSLGANAALGFGARRPNLKGIVALAPAHAPEQLQRRPKIAESVSQARTAEATGRGDQKRTFNDFNLGKIFSVSTTPTIYLSFFGPDSPAVMPVNAAHLTAPLLMVSGSDDPSQTNADDIFARVPTSSANKHVTVAADHLGTPAAASATVLTWLQGLLLR